MTLRLRRGTDLQRQSITFSEGELVYVTDTGELYVGDGSTVGGTLIVGGGGITSALTSNLNLSGYEINGTGNIAINGTVSALAIDSGIVSVDSTLIVDNVNSAFYGSFIGDGSLITNISLGDLNDFNLGTLNSGDVISWNGAEWINIPNTTTTILDGSNQQINIIGSDSSMLVNSDTNTLSGTISADLIINDGIIIQNTASSKAMRFQLNSAGDLSGSGTDRGQIFFTRNDINGEQFEAVIGGGRGGIYLHVDETAVFPESTIVLLNNSGNLGLGTYTPSAKLDVQGSAIFTGSVTASEMLLTGSLKLSDNRAYTAIASPVNGEMMYDTVTTGGGLYMYNSTTGWTRAVVEELGENATVLSTFLKLGPSDTSSRDGFGSDSNSIDGAMFYNMDAERIQYYQADSWFNMPNQSLEEDADVRFASVTANTFISTGGGAPTLESETVIDLQAAERVRVTTSPFRLAQLTTTERNAISPVAGDLIYNTTDNRFQGYQNGGWINLDDGTVA